MRDFDRRIETTMPHKLEHAPGTDLIERLRKILRRCEATGEQVNFPGEGGERRFCLWLATEFFSDLLGWPGTSVVQGERFDLILRDNARFPVITIETKTPYHEASANERRDFEKRLSAFPTLRSEGVNTQNVLECFKAFGFEGPTAQVAESSIDL
jgi:hypothetical protein